jgi:sterol desaturase/sphingolipid hydroxylase (fatty acid hydroxylase superfamily)
MLMIHNHPWILTTGLALALIEYIWRRASGLGYDLRAAAASLGVALGQSLLRPLNLVLTTAILTWVSRFAPWHVPMTGWPAWLLGFFAVEFAYYWFHRWSHEIAWMWATHAVHHSATQMVLPAAIRLGWTEFVSLGWIAFVPLALIGLDRRMIGVLLSLGLVYQYVLHTEAPISFGPFEWLLNSPAHHRVHHSSDAEFLDCNYGGVLIVFDRMFGTFRAAPAGTVLHYGLVHPEQSTNPLLVAMLGWRALGARWKAQTGIRAKLAVALGRPA